MLFIIECLLSIFLSYNRHGAPLEVEQLCPPYYDFRDHISKGVVKLFKRKFFKKGRFENITYF